MWRLNAAWKLLKIWIDVTKARKRGNKLLTGEPVAISLKTLFLPSKKQLEWGQME